MNLNQAISLVNAPSQADFTSKEMFYRDVVVNGTVTRVGENDVRVSINLDTDLVETLEVLGFDMGETNGLTLDQVQRYVNRLAKFISSNDLTPFGYVSLNSTESSEDESEESSDDWEESSEESSDY